MENKYKPHISGKKERIVDDLVSLMKEYPVIGVIDMTNLPALQFQRIKSKLSDKLEFRMVKKRLMKIALDKIKDKKDINKLKDRLEGIPALIFTKQDPFKLAKAIRKEVSAAPAKPGQIAPEVIILPAGPTPFMPGPMIGELGVMGIKTKVEGGKINVVEDKVLVKKGDVIEAKIANLLAKLGIEPMQVGFNLLLTYKDGEILEKDVLFIDEKLYLETLQQYARESESLAIYIGYVCKDTIERLLGKAYNEAKAVSDVVKLEEKMEEKEEKKEEKPAEEVKVEEKPKEHVPVEQPKVEEVKEESREEPKEEPVKEEIEVEEKPIEEEKVEEVEKPVEQPVEEKKEEEKMEIKEEPKVEEKKIAETPRIESEKIKIEETKIEEKQKEEVKEELEEEKPQEEPVEEPKLKDVKDIKVGLSVKDTTKEDIDLAAKQLQEIKDKMIKGGK